MNEPVINFVGNVSADPELRFTPTGRAVTHLGVVCNPRRQDASGQWVDGTPVYWACQAWGSLGEQAAESLRKGDRVLVTGRIKANAWTPTNGPNAGVEQKRLDVLVDELGPSLRFATTTITRMTRTNAATTRSGPADESRADADPWAQPPVPGTDPMPF